MTIALAYPMLRKVASLTALDPEEILSKRRVKPLVRARHALMLVLRERTSWSTPQIAHFLNIKDHSTVVHGISVALERCETDPLFAAIVSELRAVEPGNPFPDEPALILVRPDPEPQIAINDDEPEEIDPDDWEGDAGLFAALDDDGWTLFDLQVRSMMAAGSRKMALAMNAARRAA